MAPISLLEDCQSCLLKGYKSWESYFSKWEALAKQEENVLEDELQNECENISESELNDELEENIILPQMKKRSLKKAPEMLEPEKSIKGALKERKNIRKVIKRKKKPLKKQKAQRVTERPSVLGNNCVPVEDSGNEQLTMDLKTIFMDILRAHKNKWEIFSVLSRTFSHDKVTTGKGSHQMVLKRQLALSYSNVEIDNVRFSGNEVLSSVNRTDVFQNPRSFNLQNPNQSFQSQLWKHGLVVLPRWQKFDFESSIDRFGFCSNSNNPERSALIPANAIHTPQRQISSFSFQSRFLKSCPGKIVPSFYLNDSPYERSKMLNCSPLNFGSKHTTGECSKINKENFKSSNYEQLYFPHHPCRNVCEEKSFQNLCKRTDDVGLNMDNSNFITPKRKSPERKCFSENILQRKRRCPSKLTFFDNEDESESDDDRTVNCSPVIRWEYKKRRTEILPEKVVMDSDSDDCESIFDRVKKS